METTSTVEAPEETPDILGAMRRAKYHLDKHRATPSSFEVHDISDFKLKIKNITTVKDAACDGYEYAGIKIVQNKRALPGYLFAMDAKGNVQQVIKYV